MDRFPDDSWNPARADVLALLAEAPIVDAGMIPSASNYVFLLALEDTSAGRGYAIYKPGRGEVPLHENVELDLYYIQNYSPLLDLMILWRTIWVVLGGRGAY